MLNELYYIDYYILVFIYVRLVARLLFFERCKRMTDKQLSHLQGVFVWWLVFLLKKILKKKAACPRIKPLFTANRGSITNKQRLCFIPTEPLFFYSFPQSHLLHPRGVTQNNIISVLQPPNTAQIPPHRSKHLHSSQKRFARTAIHTLPSQPHPTMYAHGNNPKQQVNKNTPQ